MQTKPAQPIPPEKPRKPRTRRAELTAEQMAEATAALHAYRISNEAHDEAVIDAHGYEVEAREALAKVFAIMGSNEFDTTEGRRRIRKTKRGMELVEVVSKVPRL